MRFITGPVAVLGFQLDMKHNGDYVGRISFNDGWVGGASMGIERRAGVTYVRGFVGSIDGLKVLDDYDWFAVTAARNLPANTWVALSGRGQGPALAVISAAVDKYGSPAGLDTTLAPSGAVQQESDDILTDGTSTLWFSPETGAPMRLQRADADITLSGFGASVAVPPPTPIWSPA